MTDQISAELVQLDADLGEERSEVIRGLARLVGSARSDADEQSIAAAALAREDAGPTGLPGGIALPHCRTTGVSETTLAFARLTRPVDFGAPDGRPADLVFLVTHPQDGDGDHLQLLSRLTRSLVKAAYVDALREAETPADVTELIAGAIGQRSAR